MINFRDATRRDPGGALHPLQVSVWYPAARAAGPAAPMRYRDYVQVSARERTLSPLTGAEEAAALARYRGFLVSNGLAPEGVEEWLGAAMSAVRDAPAAGGRFPLVAIATGMGGAVHDQAVLGEFLASRGYVAATTPSPVRLGSRMESEADVLPRAREQAGDLSMAMDLLSARADVDRTRAGVVGYSFGARSGLLLAAMRKDVRALVSLDGGIGSAQAKDWLPGPVLSRAAFSTPLLHLYQDGDPASPPDLALLQSLSASPRWLVKLAGLRHLDFITFGFAAAAFPRLAAPASSQRPAALRAALEYTAAFLDAHVAGRAEGAAYLAADARAHGHPPGLVTVTRISAR